MDSLPLEKKKKVVASEYVKIIIMYVVSRVPANLCTNLYCHMQEGAGTRAT